MTKKEIVVQDQPEFALIGLINDRKPNPQMAVKGMIFYTRFTLRKWSKQLTRL